jgi:hypothetical protein
MKGGSAKEGKTKAKEKRHQTREDHISTWKYEQVRSVMGNKKG